MTPEFAVAVDPVIVYVVNLLDRIGDGKEPDPQEEQLRIRSLMDRAEGGLSGAHREGWALAKYALTTWTDEMLITAPWEGRSWWTNNALEFAMFQTNIAFSDFYEKARSAAALTSKNALEVFYVCVVLGFRGLYRDASAEIDAVEAGLPPTLEGWARNCAMVIQLGQGVPTINELPRPGRGAPPLQGRFMALGALVLGVFLVALVALLVVWSSGNLR